MNVILILSRAHLCTKYIYRQNMDKVLYFLALLTSRVYCSLVISWYFLFSARLKCTGCFNNDRKANTSSLLQSDLCIVLSKIAFLVSFSCMLLHSPARQIYPLQARCHADEHIGGCWGTHELGFAGAAFVVLVALALASRQASHCQSFVFLTFASMSM